jgi:hypothetical protein
MTIRIRNSRVLGSTESFYGDVDVYNTVEGSSNLLTYCPSTIVDPDYVRFNVNYTQVIDNIRDVSEITTASKTVVGAPAGRIFIKAVKSPGYIYIASGYNIVEYSEIDFSSKSLSVTGSSFVESSNIVVIGPRRIAIWVNRGEVWTVDFETDTREKIIEAKEYPEAPYATTIKRECLSFVFEGKVYLYVCAVVYTNLNPPWKTRLHIHVYNVTDNEVVLNYIEDCSSSHLFEKAVTNYCNGVVFIDYTFTQAISGKGYELYYPKIYYYDLRTNTYDYVDFGPITLAGANASAFWDYFGNFIDNVITGDLDIESWDSWGNTRLIAEGIDPVTNRLHGIWHLYNPVNGTEEVFFIVEFDLINKLYYIDRIENVAIGESPFRTTQGNNGFYFKDGYRIVSTSEGDYVTTLPESILINAYDEIEGRLWYYVVVEGVSKELKGYSILNGDTRTIDLFGFIDDELPKTVLIFNTYFLLTSNSTLSDTYIVKREI